MRRVSGLLLLCLLACERVGLRAVVGDVELSSSSLHFEPTFVGFPKTRSFTLRNTSVGDRRVRVSTEPPFSAPAEVTVPGGAELALAVVFDPSVEGNALGALHLNDGEHTFDVALDGEGVQAPACVPSGACRLSTFDGDTCVEAIASDGSACASGDACLEGGACARGVCLGNARDCADANRCTEDACEPGSGCVHLPTRCAAPSDPCKVASCDPAVGCVESDAPDGTACGPADCVTAQVCLLGRCKPLPVPDGATCSPATACQGKGTCQQQQCVRPAAQPLTEAWSYTFPGEVSGFHGVTDAAQNLFWIECAISPLACGGCSGCAATSMTRDGVLRFRRPLPELPMNLGDVPHLLAGNHLVYGLANNLSSISSSSGAPQWTLAIATALQGAPDLADRQAVRLMVADANEQVYVVIERSQSDDQTMPARQDALLKLDARTGTLVQRRFFDATLSGAVLDERDNLTLGGWVVTGGQLWSVSPSGAARWSVAVPGEPTPLAAYNGELTLRSGEVRALLDGSVRAPATVAWPMSNVLMSPTARTFLHQPPNGYCCETCECNVPAYPEVDAISLPAGGSVPNWEVPVAASNGTGTFSAMSALVATQRGDLLVAGGSGWGVNSLVAVTAAGSTRFVCEIPPATPIPDGPAIYSSAVALLSGRWAVVEQVECRNCLHWPSPTLRVFELPGEAPATHGWMTGGGNPSGASRPLQ